MDKIIVKGIEISMKEVHNENYISLTDIAKWKNFEDPRDVVRTWMRSKSTLDFLGLWEKINNSNFKEDEFDRVKIEISGNYSSISPTSWSKRTNAIGMVTKSGKYGGGTYAHKDIALEFASWVSVEFRLYLIKEFQRLKEEENNIKEWSVKRALSKINYKIHTDAIKEELIPKKLDMKQNFVYAEEADILNLALYNMTAKEWRLKSINKYKDGNIRDYSTIEQLVVLSNLESINAHFIKEGLNEKERLIKLNEIAIYQMKSLIENKNIVKLKNIGDLK